MPGSSCSLPIKHRSRDEECCLFSSFTHEDGSSHSTPLLSSSQRCIPDSWVGHCTAGQPQQLSNGTFELHTSMTELKSLLDLCLRRLYCLFSQQSLHFHFPDTHLIEQVMYYCVSTICSIHGLFHNGSFSFSWFPDSC